MCIVDIDQTIQNKCLLALLLVGDICANQIYLFHYLGNCCLFHQQNQSLMILMEKADDFKQMLARGWRRQICPKHNRTRPSQEDSPIARTYLSAGRPAICHSRIMTASPSVLDMENGSEMGMAFSLHSVNHPLMQSYTEIHTSTVCIVIMIKVFMLPSAINITRGSSINSLLTDIP